MNIIYVVTDLGLGGTQMWVEYTSVELAKRGHRVTVIAEHGPFDRRARMMQTGVCVRDFPSPGTLRQYAEILRSAHADLVHLNVWERTGELVRLGRLGNIPLVLSYHHVPKVSLRTWLSRMRRPHTGVRYAQWLLSSCWYIHAHMGCCETSARGIRRDLWPFMQQRVFVLRNAIALPEMTQERVMLGQPRFIQVGTLNERKNPLVTLRAFARVQDGYPEATLTFVGDGPLRAALEALAADMGLAGVEFAGESPEVGSFFSQCNIKVLPSKREGLPYTLIEAAGRGLALIASNVDGNPEIAVDGHNAILVSPGDDGALDRAMLRLARSPELRLRMGQNGRRLVETSFELGQQIDRLVAIYGWVCSKHRRGVRK